MPLIFLSHTVCHLQDMYQLSRDWYEIKLIDQKLKIPLVQEHPIIVKIFVAMEMGNVLFFLEGAWRNFMLLFGA